MYRPRRFWDTYFTHRFFAKTGGGPYFCLLLLLLLLLLLKLLLLPVLRPLLLPTPAACPTPRCCLPTPAASAFLPGPVFSKNLFAP